MSILCHTSERTKPHAFRAGILPTEEEVDSAWFLGLDLARRGIVAKPRRSWAEEVRAAFIDGQAEGLEPDDSDYDDLIDYLEEQARQELGTFDPAEYAEAGMRSPYGESRD